ncbi:MAG: pyridoxal phosphate-dependent aminotransferase [Lachnospiraceae bacterium]|nr:pyridoxal phosphate-dependent aminotransferase [Lachnospiraceae bacterium]
MSYDFDRIIDRTNTDSIKWDIKEGELPMWVADMDFATPPEVLDTLKQRVEHGVFGYSDVPGAWYDAYIGWWEKRYGFSMEKEGLIFSTGVIPAISSIVRKITCVAEKVLIMTPTYNNFFNSIRNNGRVPLECPLNYVKEGEGDGGSRFAIDWEGFEACAKDPQTSLFILCNPHNPTGTLWDADTLARIGEICEKWGVTVLSDEVHCDLTPPGKPYIPFASVNERNKRISVTCLSPAKTFNLAGLHSAAVYVTDPVLHHKVWRGLNTDEVAEPNAFACGGAIAAYTKGGAWVDELQAYITENKRMLSEYIREQIPWLLDASGPATYLCWVDVSRAGKSGDFRNFLRQKTGLWITDGAIYGDGGDGFVRINVACPRELLSDGLQRLKKGTQMFLQR